MLFSRCRTCVQGLLFGVALSFGLSSAAIGAPREDVVIGMGAGSMSSLPARMARHFQGASA